MSWEADSEEERKAAARIAGTRRRHRPEVKAAAAANEKAYRQRPEVHERRRLALQVWRAKYKIPSTVIPHKLGVRLPTPRPSTAATGSHDTDHEDFELNKQT